MDTAASRRPGSARLSRRFAWAWVVASAVWAALATPANAQTGDGVYGRLDSSTSVVFGAGASLETGSWDAAALLDARIRVFDCAGLATSLTLAPDTRARMFTGVELRPFFPGLFLQSMSTGRQFVDLFVQSFGVELGAEVALAKGTSVGFVWGLSIEIPILSPERFAHGLGLRLGMRHTAIFGDSRPNPAADASSYRLYALLAIGFDAGRAIADWEPVRHRHR